MSKSPKKNDKVNLDRLAGQLAKVRLLARAEERRIALSATATFASRSCEIGEYRVSIGFRSAFLRLDHPSFTLEQSYRATLAPDVFSESWKERHSKEAGAGGKLGIGARFAGLFRLDGNLSGSVEKGESAEQKGKTAYPLVTPIPGGWRIGTELGDPRQPAGAAPEGLEDCLDGEYLSGRGDEQGDGYEPAPKHFALCVLMPIPGGNDPMITATLSAGSGSLRVALERLPNALPPTGGTAIAKSDSEETARLRQAFVKICVARAEAAKQSGASTMIFCPVTSILIITRFMRRS